MFFTKTSYIFFNLAEQHNGHSVHKMAMFLKLWLAFYVPKFIFYVIENVFDCFCRITCSLPKLTIFSSCLLCVQICFLCHWKCHLMSFLNQTYFCKLNYFSSFWQNHIRLIQNIRRWYFKNWSLSSMCPCLFFVS